MKCFACFLFVFLNVSVMAFAEPQQEVFECRGTHFMADYFDCDFESISNADVLICVLSEAIKESRATVLNTMYHVFPNANGLTMLTMLSESHASIHTYPEHRGCFVDLFTCGDKCSYEKFDAILRDYLKPARMKITVINRTDSDKESDQESPF